MRAGVWASHVVGCGEVGAKISQQGEPLILGASRNNQHKECYSVYVSITTRAANLGGSAHH